MKNVIISSLAVLPLVVGGVFTNASSAAAATLNSGDILQINADFNNLASNPLKLQFKVGNTAQPIGSYGYFGIGEPSTGGFGDFENDGATNNSNYKILSVDFTNPATYLDSNPLDLSLDLPFLKATKGSDSFKFYITEEILATDKMVAGTKNGVFTLSNVKGQFVTDQGAKAGFGYLSGTFIANNATFSGTLTVASVPEPTTVAGLGLVAGVLAVSRMRKQNKA